MNDILYIISELRGPRWKSYQIMERAAYYLEKLERENSELAKRLHSDKS